MADVDEGFAARGSLRAREDRNMNDLEAWRSVQLPVGEEVLTIRVPHSVITIEDGTAGVDKPKEELGASLWRALEHPIDYPPLATAFVRGDRIVLAVEPGVPQVEAVLGEVVAYLLDHGVEDGQLTILLHSANAWLVEPLANQFAERFESSVEVCLHHEQDQEGMGYLAADQHAEPIYIDRRLLEADLVLPISCARDPQSWAYAGLYGIVPWFTDQKTQQRWRADSVKLGQAAVAPRLRIAREVAWLLGIQPVLAIVPGPEGAIERFFFGQVERIEKVIEESGFTSCVREPLQPVDLLVTTIDGDRTEQNWDNVARVLFLAEHFLSPSGSVAIITDLDQAPGAAFRWLSSPETTASAERHLLKSHHPHALAAIEILRAKSCHRLYLMSRLPAEQVEEWGITPIHDPTELERLVRAHAASMIIRGAQHRRLERSKS